MGSSQASHKGKQTALPTYKVLVMGGRGCGKSAIIRRYVTNQFVKIGSTDEDIPPITGLTPHTLTLPSHSTVGVVFWELATSPYNLIEKQQCKYSNAIIMVVSSLDEGYPARISQIEQEAKELVGSQVPLMILINNFSPEKKCDPVPDRLMLREVQPQKDYGSVHRAINIFLYKILENGHSKKYPVAGTATQLPNDESLC